jgi:hypothetical protein
MRALTSALYACILVATGCNDPARPDAAAGVRAPASPRYVNSLSVVSPETLDEEFVRLAREAPGFAGVSYSAAGEATVYLADLTGEAKARVALAHFFGARTTDGAVPTLRFVPAKYDFAQLARWRNAVDSVFQSMRDVDYTTDVNERANRVDVGVMTAGALAQVRAALAGLGIPDAALSVAMAPPIRRAESLADYPFVPSGGVAIAMRGTTSGSCSMGLSVYYQPNNIAGLLTNSHCSRTMGSVDGTEIHTGVPLTRIAVEFADPPLNRCGTNCRYSDVSFFAYDRGLLGGEFNKIARTTWSASYPPDHPSGSTEIDPNNPRWTVPGFAASNPVLNQRLDKIGFVAGWADGPVNQTCINTTHHGVTFRCSYRMNGPAMDGDSGGPIFQRVMCDGQPYVELPKCAIFVGILHGLTEGQIYFASVSDIRSDFGSTTLTLNAVSP